MSRLAFGLMGQDTAQLLAGVEVKVKNEDTDVFVASTNPTGSQSQLVDNNDGTYFVDGLPMALYSIYVGSDAVPQEELQYYFFANEEITTHINADSGVHGASDAILGKGDVVNDLVSTDTDKPLSAAQGKALEDGKAAASHSHNEADISDLDKYTQTEVDTKLDGKIIESVDTVDLEVSSSVLSMKDQDGGYTEENYVKDEWSLFKNVDRLDQRLNDVAQNQGGVDRRIIYADSIGETASGTDAAALPVYANNDTTYKIKRRAIFKKRSSDTKLLLTCEADAVDGVADAEIKISAGGLESIITVDPQEQGFSKWETTLDISSLNNNNLYEIKVQMKAGSDNTSFDMRYLFIEIE